MNPALEQSISTAIADISKTKRNLRLNELKKSYFDEHLKNYFEEVWKPEHPKSPMKSFVIEVLNLKVDVSKAPGYILSNQFEKEVSPSEETSKLLKLISQLTIRIEVLEAKLNSE